MSLRTSLFFLLAISSGLIAAAGVTQLRSNQLSKQFATVLAVKKTIPRGSCIQSDHLVAKRVPSEIAEGGLATSPEDVIGRVATFTMLEGELVMKAKLTSNKANSGVAALIPAGMRAKSITAINPADRVSGLIDVGDHVDVLLARSVQGERRGSVGVSETLLQNIEVLAIDRTIESRAKSTSTAATSRAEPKSSSITVLVTPEQAALLSLAQREGVLSFSLRNAEDQTVLDESSEPDRFEKLISKKQTPSNPPDDDASILPEDHLDLEQSVASSTDFDLVESFEDELENPTQRSTAIRTIRGSRVGVVPVNSEVLSDRQLAQGLR